jgi:hypothetical protein
MINPAWPEIAKATPANLHHQVGRDQQLDGQCSSDTRVGIAAAGSDDFERTPFECNSAIVSYHEDRGSLMLQFAKKQSNDGSILGFAGTLDGREMLQVERVYLPGGASPRTPNDGYCKLFWNGRLLSSIACGAQIDADGKRIVPVVSFEAK